MWVNKNLMIYINAKGKEKFNKIINISTHFRQVCQVKIETTRL